MREGKRNCFDIVEWVWQKSALLKMEQIPLVVCAAKLGLKG